MSSRSSSNRSRCSVHCILERRVCGRHLALREWHAGACPPRATRTQRRCKEQDGAKTPDTSTRHVPSSKAHRGPDEWPPRSLAPGLLWPPQNSSFILHLPHHKANRNAAQGFPRRQPHALNHPRLLTCMLHAWPTQTRLHSPQPPPPTLRTAMLWPSGPAGLLSSDG